MHQINLAKIRAKMARNPIKIGQKVSKRGIIVGKSAEIENPYPDAQLHINMCSNIKFQENISNGLGVVINVFY